jgi:hypothetical protein
MASSQAGLLAASEAPTVTAQPFRKSRRVMVRFIPNARSRALLISLSYEKRLARFQNLAPE